MVWTFTLRAATGAPQLGQMSFMVDVAPDLTCAYNVKQSLYAKQATDDAPLPILSGVDNASLI